MAADSLCVRVGYDLQTLNMLPEQQRRRVVSLGKWYLLPCLLLSAGLASLVWMVEHSLWLSLCLGGASALFVWNLLRLLVAGGGAAPQRPEAEAKKWAPPLAPLLVLGLLSACLAQPVQLLLPWSARDSRIDELRQQLVQRHAQALQHSLQSGAPEQNASVSSHAAYRARVQRCSFVAQRLARLWHVPEGPFAFTGLFCLLALAPLLLGHTTHLQALRAYELARWRKIRDWVRVTEHDTQREVNELLAGFVHFAPGALPKLNAPPAQRRLQQRKART